MTDRINAWYAPSGALITDAPVPGCDMPLLNDDSARFYTGPYMVAESMSLSTAKTIASALGLVFRDADQAHRERIHAEIAEDIDRAICHGDGNDRAAPAVLTAIAAGRIRHLTINY